MSDEALLDVRVCDLPVAIERTVIAQRLRRLFEELDEHGLQFRPKVWVSSEWFSPDGVPGFAVPFYLLHPRLARLERRMMLNVEGGGERECMKIMRHETGHAIATAYRLYYRKSWRETFGLFSQPYPKMYSPDPSSRDFVLHFKAWYAQAHPAEDFAETFAVWLRPRSQWRRQYQGWPALRKLEVVDELMAEIADELPKVRTRERPDSLPTLTMTLREHYAAKRRRYGEEWPDFYDRDLRRIFSSDSSSRNRMSAAAFIQDVRPRVREFVAEWTGHHPYNIDQVLTDMVHRCRELKLRLARPKRDAEFHLAVMLTVQTMNYLHAGHHQFAI